MSYSQLEANDIYIYSDVLICHLIGRCGTLYVKHCEHTEQKLKNIIVLDVGDL